MPIVDAHAILGAPPDSVRPGTLPELESVCTQSRINAVMLASSQAAAGDFRRGNATLAEAIGEKSNLFGYVGVNPSYPEESNEEIRKWLARPNFKAVKLARAAAGPRIASEGFHAILFSARRYGVPVLIETEHAADVRDVLTLAAEYHTLKFILGGMGEDDWETAIGACREQLNCYVELGSLTADRDKVGDAVAALTPRRVLFGSHFPRQHPIFVLGMVRDAAISDADRERVLFRNAVELFGLEARRPATA